MKIGKILVLIPFFWIIISCGLSPLEEKANQFADEIVNVNEESTLFIEDSSNANLYLFETNDTRYLNNAGYTLFTTNKTNESDGFETINVDMMKLAGNAEAGYGIIFCEQTIDSKPFMLSILINTNGLYTIGKITNGEFYHLDNNWRYSSHINKGYGIKNKVSVSYDENLSSFNLQINDSDITSFTIPERITFKNSKSGFVVVISNRENFPEKSVKVEFEIQ